MTMTAQDRFGRSRHFDWLPLQILLLVPLSLGIGYAFASAVDMGGHSYGDPKNYLGAALRVAGGAAGIAVVLALSKADPARRIAGYQPALAATLCLLAGALWALYGITEAVTGSETQRPDVLVPVLAAIAAAWCAPRIAAVWARRRPPGSLVVVACAAGLAAVPFVDAWAMADGGQRARIVLHHADGGHPELHVVPMLILVTLAFAAERRTLARRAAPQPPR